MKDYASLPISESGYTFSMPPPIVGAYDLGGSYINLTKRPSWFQRAMVSWCFGWTWLDA